MRPPWPSLSPVAKPKSEPRGVAYEFSRRGKTVDLLFRIRVPQRKPHDGGMSVTIIDKKFGLKEKVNLNGYNATPVLTVKLEASVPEPFRKAAARRRFLSNLNAGSPILK